MGHLRLCHAKAVRLFGSLRICVKVCRNSVGALIRGNTPARRRHVPTARKATRAQPSSLIPRRPSERRRSRAQWVHADVLHQSPTLMAHGPAIKPSPPRRLQALGQRGPRGQRRSLPAVYTCYRRLAQAVPLETSPTRLQHGLARKVPLMETSPVAQRSLKKPTIPRRKSCPCQARRI